MYDKLNSLNEAALISISAVKIKKLPIAFLILFLTDPTRQYLIGTTAIPTTLLRNTVHEQIYGSRIEVPQG